MCYLYPQRQGEKLQVTEEGFGAVFLGECSGTSVLALKEKGAVDAYASPKVGGKLLMIRVSHTMKNISELVPDSPRGI